MPPLGNCAWIEPHATWLWNFFVFIVLFLSIINSLHLLAKHPSHVDQWFDCFLVSPLAHSRFLMMGFSLARVLSAVKRRLYLSPVNWLARHEDSLWMTCCCRESFPVISIGCSSLQSSLGESAIFSSPEAVRSSAFFFQEFSGLSLAHIRLSIYVVEMLAGLLTHVCYWDDQVCLRQSHFRRALSASGLQHFVFKQALFFLNGSAPVLCTTHCTHSLTLLNT